MLRITARFNGAEHIFRTNNSGSYLFTGLSVNNQISCESGFNSLSRIKRYIKKYLRQHYYHNQDDIDVKKYPKITYITNDNRKK
jgi:hypothetical protein